MKYTITFFSYWRIGTGLGGGSKDNILMKDDDNLPVIPGKTLKGLIRDAYNELGYKNEIEIFGQKLSDISEPTNKEELEEGKFYFGSAQLPEDIKSMLANNKSLTKELYDTVTTTRLDKDKQNVDSALVKSEVCIPVTLEAEILLKDKYEMSDENLRKTEENLAKALKMLRLIGEKRYRGLGRCKIDINHENPTS